MGLREFRAEGLGYIESRLVFPNNGVSNETWAV